MGLILYKEDALAIDANPAIIVLEDTDPAPSGYSAFVDIEDIDRYCFGLSSYDYKVVRDCIKKIVTDTGWGNLSTTEQQIAARHNIGTGAQILAAVPNDLTRDANSEAYLANMRGAKISAVRPYRSIKLEARAWSRCKHIEVEPVPAFFVTVPEFIYNLITISNPNAGAGELGGNLLIIYENAGILGFAGGDKSLGILDFIESTVGTRFEFEGLTTHPLLSGIVPSGYSNVSDFATDLGKIIKLGI